MTDWMSKIPSDFLISEINLPGTHDSCARYVDFSYFSKCQNMSIYEQLHIGIRFIDIRVEQVGDRLRLVHSISKCYKDARHSEILYFDDVLQDCFLFLKKYPTETIIMSLKRDNGGSSEDAFDTFFNSYLHSDDPWYLENRVPTMGEARGKIILFNRCCVNYENPSHTYTDYNTGLNFSGFPDQSKSTESGFITAQIPRRDNKRGYKYFQQDMYKLKPKQKWENGILPTLENPLKEQGIAINFFSAGRVLHNPKRTSKYIYKRLEKTKLQPLKKYGWIVLDFPTEKICRKIILTNF